METNGKKYIEMIADMYGIDQDDKDVLDEDYEKINKALEKFNWPDVKRAVNYYCVYKSDKVRPTIAKIVAILNTWLVEKKIHYAETFDDTPNPFARPTTKIWSIKDAFDKMIDIFIDGGVIPDDKGNVKNIRSIIDPITDLPVLNPIMWFGWKLEAVKQTRPDLFVRFPNATNLEQLAIALQNKLIPFKVRDWARLAEQARQRNGGVMPRGDINVGFGTVGE